LTYLALAPTLGANTLIDRPRLAPEGDTMFVRQTVNSMYRLSAYHRAGDGAWTYGYDVPVTTTQDIWFGAPTRGAGARRIIWRVPSETLHEAAEERGWGDVATYTPADFGVANFIGAANLSEDGLRMVFAGSLQIATMALYYADRPA